MGDSCDQMTPDADIPRYDQEGFDYYFEQMEMNARHLDSYDDDYPDSGYGYEENPGYDDYDVDYY